MDRTAEPPFPDSARTGRAFIAPCCTAAIGEFLVDGVLWLASSVAGHGRSAPWQARIEDINDTGIVEDADGTERRVWWRGDREDHTWSNSFPGPAPSWPALRSSGASRRHLVIGRDGTRADVIAKYERWISQQPQLLAEWTAWAAAT